MRVLPVAAQRGQDGSSGGTRQVYRCATCKSSLEATDSVCPGCGGTIAGDIAHRRDWLDAEERLEAEERRAAGHGPDAAD